MYAEYPKNLAVDSDMQLMVPIWASKTISYRLVDYSPLNIVFNRRNRIDIVNLNGHSSVHVCTSLRVK